MGHSLSFWVYVLRCSDRSYYTGHTDNLERRIAEHRAGEGGGYTSTRLPVSLVFSQELPTREQALACERQIKGWSRKKKEAMMKADWAEVSRLAKSPSTGSGRTDVDETMRGV
jgi:predicted GIY-YIG superfamily endonuclease